MSSIRIAILIFLVGASLANLFYTRSKHDHYIQPLPGSYDYLDTITVYQRNQREVADASYMREAVIVTIAGVAWFALSRESLKR